MHHISEVHQNYSIVLSPSHDITKVVTIKCRTVRHSDHERRERSNQVANATSK